MFTYDLAAQINGKDFPESLRGPWLKLKGYCARLALIIQQLRCAANEADQEDVDGESVNRAVQLVHYFQSQIRKVYCVIDVDHGVRLAKRLLDWIIREKRSEFKRWEPYEDLKNDRDFCNVEDLDAPLHRLTKHNLIRPKHLPERKGPGRTPAPAFQVNPSLFQRPVNPVNPGNWPRTGNFLDLQDLQDGAREAGRDCPKGECA